MRTSKGPSSIVPLHSVPDPDPGSAPALVFSPASSAAVGVRDAQEALVAADDAVRVAEARLREALDAAPRISPRLAAAEEAVATSRAVTHRLSQTVAARRRGVDDAEGAVEAAQAAQEDLLTGEKKATTGDLVGARVKVDKASRALRAAQAALVDAEEARAAAEAELSAAEAHLLEVRQEPLVESAVVVTARGRVAAAERVRNRAGERLAAARLEAAREAERPGGPLVTEFASLDAFVDGYVLPNWRHRPSQGHWCATWWQHGEAIARLEAVWEAFEVMRLEPAPALSTWWRDHLDVHMRALTSVDGTFAGCSASRHETVHQQQDVWASTPPEPGLFDTDPESPRQPARDRQIHTQGA